uniref:Proliferating cell nuclear antigen PCNA N-terminal domain-containing protein n=1 Tax=viral metagenome TaxID=1070528 RepID=A0A6C0LUW9_9ZZZZ
MPIKFKCKTGEAYQIKVLAELLTNNLKTACFEVSRDGISLRMFDHPRKTLVDLSLLGENFSLYKFKYDEKFCMGLNLNHFHRMLKSIKKKDSLQLFIDTDNPIELGIKTIPKENTRITTSGINIQEIQNLEIDTPKGYGKPVIVPSSEFQKMCKDLSSIGSVNINVRARKFHIEFIADADGILKRKVTFGENEDSDDDSDEDIPEYYATFTTDQLSRITKLAGLSNTMQIFPANNNLPLLFRSSVGSLGKISIYVKSQELLDSEPHGFNDDNDDSDSDYE